MTSSYLRNVESESVSIFFQGYELQGKLFLITRRRAKEKINSILPSKLFLCFSSFKQQQLKRESRRTKIIFFTALTWKNGPTMNDNSSMTLKPSYRTKVFAF